MPVFDTPITTTDTSLDRVLAQKLPILLILYDQSSSMLNDTMNRIASDNAGKLLIVRVHASDNPQTYERYGSPALPALIALQDGEVKSQAEWIQSSDVTAHSNFLLGKGPQPSAKPTTPSASSEANTDTSSNIPVKITDASFEADVLKSDIPVLVDFWAEWCGPCKMIAPSLEHLAKQYAGKVKIAKLNIDENPQATMRYQVMGIPLLMMFKGGQSVGKLVGAHPQGNIEQLIKQAL